MHGGLERPIHKNTNLNSKIEQQIKEHKAKQNASRNCKHKTIKAKKNKKTFVKHRIEN